MQVTATLRGARISAFKAREVTREIQGLPASDALTLLKFVPKKAAPMISKTLASAVANAENNNGLNAADLVVKEATVGEGMTMKRIRPRARGSASAIRKRMSHIRIVVTDELPIVRRGDKKKTSSRKKAAAKPAAAAAETPVSEAMAEA